MAMAAPPSTGSDQGMYSHYLSAEPQILQMCDDAGIPHSTWERAVLLIVLDIEKHYPHANYHWKYWRGEIRAFKRIFGISKKFPGVEPNLLSGSAPVPIPATIPAAAASSGPSHQPQPAPQPTAMSAQQPQHAAPSAPPAPPAPPAPRRPRPKLLDSITPHPTGLPPFFPILTPEERERRDRITKAGRLAAKKANIAWRKGIEAANDLRRRNCGEPLLPLDPFGYPRFCVVATFLNPRPKNSFGGKNNQHMRKTQHYFKVLLRYGVFHGKFVVWVEPKKSSQKESERILRLCGEATAFLRFWNKRQGEMSRCMGLRDHYNAWRPGHKGTQTSIYRVELDGPRGDEWLRADREKERIERKKKEKVSVDDSEEDDWSLYAHMEKTNRSSEGRGSRNPDEIEIDENDMDVDVEDVDVQMSDVADEPSAPPHRPTKGGQKSRKTSNHRNDSVDHDMDKSSGDDGPTAPHSTKSKPKSKKEKKSKENKSTNKSKNESTTTTTTAELVHRSAPPPTTSIDPQLSYKVPPGFAKSGDGTFLRITSTGVGTERYSHPPGYLETAEGRFIVDPGYAGEGASGDEVDIIEPPPAAPKKSKDKYKSKQKSKVTQNVNPTDLTQESAKKSKKKNSDSNSATDPETYKSQTKIYDTITQRHMSLSEYEILIKQRTLDDAITAVKIARVDTGGRHISDTDEPSNAFGDRPHHPSRDHFEAFRQNRARGNASRDVTHGLPRGTFGARPLLVKKGGLKKGKKGKKGKKMDEENQEHESQGVVEQDDDDEDEIVDRSQLKRKGRMSTNTQDLEDQNQVESGSHQDEDMDGNDHDSRGRKRDREEFEDDDSVSHLRNRSRSRSSEYKGYSGEGGSRKRVRFTDEQEDDDDVVQNPPRSAGPSRQQKKGPGTKQPKSKSILGSRQPPSTQSEEHDESENFYGNQEEVQSSSFSSTFDFTTDFSTLPPPTTRTKTQPQSPLELPTQPPPHPNLNHHPPQKKKPKPKYQSPSEEPSREEIRTTRQEIVDASKAAERARKTAKKERRAARDAAGIRPLNARGTGYRFTEEEVAAAVAARGEGENGDGDADEAASREVEQAGEEIVQEGMEGVEKQVGSEVEFPESIFGNGQALTEEEKAFAEAGDEFDDCMRAVDESEATTAVEKGSVANEGSGLEDGGKENETNVERNTIAEGVQDGDNPSQEVDILEPSFSWDLGGGGAGKEVTRKGEEEKEEGEIEE